MEESFVSSMGDNIQVTVIAATVVGIAISGIVLALGYCYGKDIIEDIEEMFSDPMNFTGMFTEPKE